MNSLVSNAFFSEPVKMIKVEGRKTLGNMVYETISITINGNFSILMVLTLIF